MKDYNDPAERAARYAAMYDFECSKTKVSLPDDWHWNNMIFQDGLQQMRKYQEQVVRAAFELKSRGQTR